MGFWSGLLKGATSFIPGVGGIVSNAIDMVDGSNAVKAGLGTAGDIAKGREAGRQSEFQNGVLRNQQDLRQRQFANESQGDAYHKAMLGALGMNVQDAHINRPLGVPDTGISGGLRPSAMGMQGREAAGVLNQKAMERLRTGEKFAELPSTKGNWIDSLLGVAGTIGKGVDNYDARQSGDEQNSMIRDILNNALKQQQGGGAPSAAGSAGEVAPQAGPTPSVNTSWDWQSPGYGGPGTGVIMDGPGTGGFFGNLPQSQFPGGGIGGNLPENRMGRPSIWNIFGGQR